MNEIAVPNDCRAIALMNIQSYAGGTKFTNKGRSDDGLIEIVFFTNIIRMATSAVLSPIMPFLRFRVAAQSSKVCIRINQPLHCQVDGEPWLQKEAIFQISHFGRSTILRRKKSSSNCADQSSVEHSSFSDGTHCSSSMESD
uniref:Diacylglycerol kinase accessory domain-containing protein n=1 Tax=Proboscia inermis TaxID=420281 RepID=A0A7S0GDP9_9STRA|mmetsp:Transcript_28490/g.28834  ORF Transcript_28490/g.28834 Transcript_28490/m.28834 type:complete len:142 (+) Transcript_28490:1-426(+)